MMGETEIEKISTEYRLTNGQYHIHAIIYEKSKKITIKPSNSHDEFLFRSSDPEVAYIIGTLIRDAADLMVKLGE